jgi:hypothetical protein
MKDLFSHNTFNFSVVYDNTDGLPKVYNKFLNDKQYKNNILLFVHDDVELEDVFLVDKLQNSPYKIRGLAGCTQANNNKPPAWHLMCERTDYVGEVTHKNQQRTWTTVYGSTDARALLIDGLFIAVDVKEANSKGIEFDEDFQFHHYDLSFCLRCNQAKVTVGVLPVRVIHHGLGDSANTPEWFNSAVHFSKKYGNGSFRG